MNPHDIERPGVERHVHLALRREPDAGPPAGFAQSVAALARESAADPAVERWLMRALVAAFALAGIVVAAIYGRQWLPAFGSLPLLDATTVNWAVAMLACVALSWSLDRLRTAQRRR